MVNNHGNRHSPDAVLLFQQIFHVDVQIHRPTEFHDVLHAAIQDIELYIAARPVEQVETDAADAAFVQSLQFALRRFVVDAGDAPKAAAGLGDGIQCCCVVKPVHAGLNDYAPLDPDNL